MQPKQDWTPEPWELHAADDIRGVNGRKIAWTATAPDSEGKGKYAQRRIGDTANAARIVSCVNACTGMQDPAQEIAELRSQRDALLKAAKATLHDCPDIDQIPSNEPGRDEDAWTLLYNAIARAEATVEQIGEWMSGLWDRSHEEAAREAANV